MDADFCFRNLMHLILMDAVGCRVEKARLPHLHRSLVFHMALPVSYASLGYRSRALQRLRELG
jgi:hypothetical protein